MAYPYINVWAVLSGTLALWVLGALWYSPGFIQQNHGKKK